MIETRDTSNEGVVTDSNRVLTQKEVAEYFSVSVAVLIKWRRENRGPAFVRMGKRLIRYRQQDLDKWMEENRQYC